MQVDPLASRYYNQSTYQYSNNDPVYYTDPSGAGGDERRGGRYSVYNEVHDRITYGSLAVKGMESAVWVDSGSAWGGGGGFGTGMTYTSFNGGSLDKAFLLAKDAALLAAAKAGDVRALEAYGQKYGMRVNLSEQSQWVDFHDVDTSTKQRLPDGTWVLDSWVITTKMKTARQGCAECGFHFFAGAEMSVTTGLVNFAGQIKNIVGAEMRVGVKERFKVSVSSAYGPSRATGTTTKTGAYVPELFGAGSTYSTTTILNDDGSEMTTESWSIGAGAFGVQINMDGLGVKDVRFGLDGAVSLAAFLGIDVGTQLGLIYINH